MPESDAPPYPSPGDPLPDDMKALLAWGAELAERHWRGLVWISGCGETCRSRAGDIWHSTAWRAPLWVAHSQPAGIDPNAWLPAAKARTRLGSEQDLVVFDAVSAGSGFDPEAFGALSGTLRAGGLLVLLTPADWGRAPDADYLRLADYPYRLEQLSARYLQRLARLFGQSDALAHWHDTLLLPSLPPVSAPRTAVVDPDCATSDQVEAVALLMRLRRRRPVVLTADRGRGKSAALGIACARWLASGERHIRVTAPSPTAVEPLFERLAALCPEGARQANRFVWTFDAATRCVEFVAPDALSFAIAAGEVESDGALLLVDEAAAIPAPALLEWLRHFPRIVFATTLHGYEGSGRGFALRFRAHLERETPEWRRFHLSTPVRFGDNDPLERLTSQALMLDAEPAQEALVAQEASEYRHLSREVLAFDEPRLRELFGLLVQAHYRTRPSDLRRLLDASATRVSTLQGRAHTQAILVAMDEGGFPAELAEAVARGERRPRGHLLAQSLAAHAGSRQALRARLRRVMRIAVHPARQRQGLGSRLLAADVERAQEEGIDLLGASFGAEPGLMAFWRDNGCVAVRLGLTRETSSGEHALMVVRGVSDAGQQLAEKLQRRFQALLPALLAFELNTLEPRIAAALLAEGPIVELPPEAVQDIDDVAFGHREPALARPALQALVRRGLACGAPPDSDEAELLVAMLFQGREPAWLAKRLGVPGRRQVQARLRQALSRWRQWASATG